MSWSGIASNQLVTWENLQDAVNNGIFLQIGTIPPSGFSAKKCVRKDLAFSAVEVQSSPLSGTADNQGVVKSKLVAVSFTYYQLTPCGAGTTAWTRVSPALGTGQRYILPSSTFYYYNGTSSTQSTIPSGYNGSIQIVSGQTYCP
jgi:hypothetical protein